MLLKRPAHPLLVRASVLKVLPTMGLGVRRAYGIALRRGPRSIRPRHAWTRSGGAGRFLSLRCPCPGAS
eukprot:scaffold653555_cov66-Prasinocladus_malaysianus.AAC.1